MLVKPPRTIRRMSTESIQSHPLVFSLMAPGFAAQTAFTLERYRGTTLDDLEAGEGPEKRYWWQRT